MGSIHNRDLHGLTSCSQAALGQPQPARALGLHGGWGCPTDGFSGVTQLKGLEPICGAQCSRPFLGRI